MGEKPLNNAQILPPLFTLGDCMKEDNILWYQGDDLDIEFSGVPKVGIRYVLPSHKPHEVKAIKKYPFINKKTISVALIDKIKDEVYYFSIPKGYCFDGASVPRFFWRIIGSNTDNSFLIASMIHDVLCENHHFVNNDRKFSTKVFDALLTVSEVSPFKRWLMANSVDLFQRTQGWD